MTISTEVSKLHYEGTGSQTTFPYTFKIFKNSDLVVILTNSDGVDTTWTLDTQYTVTGANNPNGGNVVVKSGYIPTANERLTIYREVDMKQESDYVENSPFHAKTLEADLDKGVMVDQQLLRQSDNTIRIPETDQNAVTLLGNAVTRANRVLSFDDDGGAAVSILRYPNNTLIDEVEYFTLTSGIISDKYVTLTYSPYHTSEAIMDVIGGSVQVYGVDFTIDGKHVTWDGLDAEDILNIGDEIRVYYASGTSANGADGTSGTSGSSGADGTSGSSGSSGTSGADGTLGSSGTSGADGTSGSSGSSGTSALGTTSGTSGSSGTSGADGTSGSSGTSGADGTSGSSGTSGADGTSGSSGSSGTSGADGTSGSSGSSGTSGADGTSGSSGSSGTSGADGTSGSSGSSGTSGDGTSGSSGSSGTSGVGTSGSSGTSGADGTSGTSGADGTSGSSGTSGADGTSGSSGSSGTSGPSDHGSLTGLDNDDHPQYILVDGTRGFTSTVSGTMPTEDYHLATKEYADTLSGTGQTNTASNLGSGEGVYSTKIGADLQFKSLIGGDNITLTSDSNEVTISGSAGGGGTSGSSGTSGADGTSGSSGSSGTSGAAGTSGSSGSSGTSGAAGTSGSSGTSGADGTSGSSGSSGSSGTSGDQAIAGAYIHTQTVVSGTWNVNHQLGYKYVNVEVIEDAASDCSIIPESICFIDTNNLIITFSDNLSGWAAITSGGGQAGTSGSSGTSGADGTSGSSGSSGSSGTSGADGTSGSSGSSGTSGVAGTSGSSGTSGGTDIVNDTTPQLGGDLYYHECNQVFDTAVSFDNTAAGDIITVTYGESVVFGDLVYADGTANEFMKGLATNAAVKHPVMGVALETKSNGQSGKMLLRGTIRDATHFSGFAMGDLLFLSDATAGAWLNAAPSDSGDIVQILGFVIAANYAFFNPDYTYVEVP